MTATAVNRFASLPHSAYTADFADISADVAAVNKSNVFSQN
jgi:hypothetical protein